MNAHDKIRFAKAIAATSEVFGKSLSEAATGLYFEALKEYPVEAVESALGACIKRCSYMPRPAEIIEAMAGPRLDLDDQAEAALRLAIENADIWTSTAFEDKTIHFAIHALGGWQTWCEQLRMASERALSDLKWSFRRLYKVHANQRFDGAPRLIGAHESHNDQNADWAKYNPPVRHVGCDYPIAIERATEPKRLQ